MAGNNRPSLDSLVPLMMLENEQIDNQQDELTCEPPIGLQDDFEVQLQSFVSILEILRHFESGDIVLAQFESQCLPAIVFNINGLVMTFDSKSLVEQNPKTIS